VVLSSGVEGKRKTLRSATATMRDEEGKKRQKKKKENGRGVVASYKRDEKEVEGTSRYEPEAEVEEPATKKRKKRPRDEVEEVVDPSITVKKPRLEKDGKSKKSKGDLAKTDKGGGIKTDLDKFKDSRGAGGRKRTEEGFPIYTEEELGMNKESGDTALCPFDCDCCY